MKAHTLESLIAEYLEQVKKATDLLEYSCGTKNILRLWRIQKKPRCGMVIGDVTYELHGIGCCVYLSGICIDFDYGPDGRVDGFDAWRLYIYACELPKRHKKYTRKEALDHEFNEYLKLEKNQKNPRFHVQFVFHTPLIER